jgi:hypothetical protein
MSSAVMTESVVSSQLEAPPRLHPASTFIREAAFAGQMMHLWSDKESESCSWFYEFFVKTLRESLGLLNYRNIEWAEHALP